MKFKDVPKGAKFFDPMSGSDFRKLNDVVARSVDSMFPDEVDNFDPDDEVEIYEMEAIYVGLAAAEDR